MTAQPTLAPDDEHAYVLGYVAAIQAAASAARLILPASVLAVADDAGTIPALAPLKAICARHNRTVRLHPQFIQTPTVAQCFGHRGIADLIQARPPADDASRSLIAYAMTADLVITRGGKAGTVLIAERMAGDATRSPWVAMTERNAAVFFLGCTYTVQRLSPKRRVMQTVKIDLFREWLAGRLGTRQTTDGYVSNPCQRAIVDGRLNTYPGRTLSSRSHAKPIPRRWGSKHALNCPLWELVRLMIVKGVVPTTDGLVELSETAKTQIDRPRIMHAVLPHGASDHWATSFRLAFGRVASSLQISVRRVALPESKSQAYAYIFPSIPELRHRYRIIHGVDPIVQHEAIEQREGFDHDLIGTDLLPASNVLDDMRHIAMQFQPVTADPTIPSARPYVKKHPKWDRPVNAAVV